MDRLFSLLIKPIALGMLLISASYAEDERVGADVLLAHPTMTGSLRLLDAWLDASRDYQDIPGLSVGIVYDEDLIWQQNYGFSNLESQLPASSDTIYSVCSISKLFTSIGIMQLRDAGNLHLNDPVASHLDWFDIEQLYPEGGAVTIEGLLTHSSGLPRDSAPAYWNQPGFAFPNREEMIATLAQQETLYPSATHYQYSNLAMAIAGEIIQETSGINYQEYIQSKILDPLNMDDTRLFYPEELKGDQLAIGYSGFDRRRVREPVESFDADGLRAAAGMTSTVNDLARFIVWQFATLNGKENSILDRNTLREMQRVHWIDQDWEAARGLGFSTRRLDGDTAVGHNGACPGYITQIYLMPRYRIASIVLTNAGDGPARNLATNLLQSMRTAVRSIKRPFRGEHSDFSAFEGHFAGEPWGGEVAIIQKGEHLIALNLPSWDFKGAQIRLKHKEDNVFVRLTDDNEERETWTFTLDDAGKASKIQRHAFEMYRLE